MARSPHAAKQLKAQLVTKLRRKEGSKAFNETMLPVGDPDGLGVWRTFVFDPASSVILIALLPALEDDGRILLWQKKALGSGKTAREVVTVTFSAGPKADDRSPFPLDAVDQADV